MEQDIVKVIDLGNMESLEYALTEVDKIVFCAGISRPDERDFIKKIFNILSRRMVRPLVIDVCTVLAYYMDFNALLLVPNKPGSKCYNIVARAPTRKNY